MKRPEPATNPKPTLKTSIWQHYKWIMHDEPRDIDSYQEWEKILVDPSEDTTAWMEAHVLSCDERQLMKKHMSFATMHFARLSTHRSTHRYLQLVIQRAEPCNERSILFDLILQYAAGVVTSAYTRNVIATFIQHAPYEYILLLWGLFEERLVVFRDPFLFELWAPLVDRFCQLGYPQILHFVNLAPLAWGTMCLTAEGSLFAIKCITCADAYADGHFISTLVDAVLKHMAVIAQTTCGRCVLKTLHKTRSAQLLHAREHVSAVLYDH